MFLIMLKTVGELCEIVPHICSSYIKTLHGYKIGVENHFGNEYSITMQV